MLIDNKITTYGFVDHGRLKTNTSKATNHSVLAKSTEIEKGLGGGVKRCSGCMENSFVEAFYCWHFCRTVSKA